MGRTSSFQEIAESLSKARSFVPNLRNLTRASRVEIASAGDCIIRQGEIGDCFYLVLSGEVSVSLEDLDHAEVARLGVGEIFGEMAIIAREPRSASVHATTDCRLLRIDAVSAEALFCASPGTRERLGHLSVERTEENLSCFCASLDGPNPASEIHA